jgi:hypothetical protein
MSKYAFPSAHDPKTGVAQIGMTLRDYLAAAALQGLIARGVNPESIPQQAYEYADKMLKERDETPRHSNLVDGDNVNP